MQPLIEGRHGNFNRVNSNVHRGQAGNTRKKMLTEDSHKQLENWLMIGKMFPEMHPGNLHIKYVLSYNN